MTQVTFFLCMRVLIVQDSLLVSGRLSFVYFMFWSKHKGLNKDIEDADEQEFCVLEHTFDFYLQLGMLL